MNATAEVTRHHNQPPIEERITSEELVPFQERISCTIREAAAASGLRPTTLYGLIGAGELESTKVGRRRLVIVRSLRKLIEGDAAVQPKTPEAA